MYVLHHVCSLCLQKTEEAVWIPWNQHWKWLWVTIWMLGTKPRSCARVSCALKYWATTSDPMPNFFVWILKSQTEVLIFVQQGLYILNHISRSWWLKSESSVTFPHWSLSTFWLLYLYYFLSQSSMSPGFTFFQVLHRDFLWQPWSYIPMHTTLSITLLKIFYPSNMHFLYLYIFVCDFHYYKCVCMVRMQITCASAHGSQSWTLSVFFNSFPFIYIVYGESLTWT